MKRQKKLLLLLGCLLVVCLAAWGATKLFAKDPQIIPMKSGDVIFALEDTKTLSWAYAENQITFDISGDAWVYPGDETYSIGKLYQMDILDQLTELRSQKSIAEPGDLADYGLAQPTCTITADEKTILIGDATGVGAHRYVSVGDGKVYLVSDTVLYPFSHSLAEMIAIPALPDLSNVSALTVTTQTDTMELSCDTEGNWLLTDDTAVSPAAASSLIGCIAKLRLTACADIDLQEPATYGLDAPCAVYEISYTDESGEDTLTLTIGGSCDDGVYVMLGDANRVYLIKKDTGSFLGQLNRESLLEVSE